MPTKAEKKRIDGAVAAFHVHYSSSVNWGPERWDGSLYQTLAQPTRYAALVNKFVSRDEVDQILSTTENSLEPMNLPGLKQTEHTSTSSAITILEKKTTTPRPSSPSPVFLFPPPTPLPSTTNPDRKLFSHWNLDAASVLAANMLSVQPGDKVLDLCAAPGGKSVSLSQLLFPLSGPGSGCLHSNEIDPARNKRLAINLQSYIPLHLFESGTVRVLRLDGTDVKAVNSLPLGAGGYDKVLLDAPCSSERHIIHAYTKAAAAGRIAEEMARWRPGSSKALAKVQAGLLMTALRAVRVGGRVLYSTCSIERGENDGVLEKVLMMLEQERKKNGLGWTIRVETRAGGDALDDAGLDLWSERTEYGRIALPDHPGGGRWGPLFFAVITKIPLKP